MPGSGYSRRLFREGCALRVKVAESDGRQVTAGDWLMMLETNSVMLLLCILSFAPRERECGTSFWTGLQGALELHTQASIHVSINDGRHGHAFARQEAYAGGRCIRRQYKSLLAG